MFKFGKIIVINYKNIMEGNNKYLNQEINRKSKQKKNLSVFLGIFSQILENFHTY